MFLVACNLCGRFFAMARRSSKNPLDDIVGQAGGWLGGAASSLNTFLTGQNNPTTNPQTRRVISASQAVGDIVTGGAVSAMQQGPEAVQRYANTQIALAAAGIAAQPVAQVVGRGVSAVGKSKAGKALASRLPVSQKTVKQIRRQNAIDMLQMAERMAARADRKYMRQQRKTAQMANEVIKQYQEFNPVYSRAEAMHIEDVGRQLREANAPAMEIPIDPKAVSRNLGKAANEIFRETMEVGSRKFDEQYPGWQSDVFNQLKKDIEQAQVYQRARGMMHRTGVETTRRLPKNTIEQKLAAEFRQEELMDRLETQYLRSMMRRGGRGKPR